MTGGCVGGIKRQLTSNYFVFRGMAEGLQRKPTWEEALSSQHSKVLQAVASGGPRNPALLAVSLRTQKAVQATSFPSPGSRECTPASDVLAMVGQNCSPSGDFSETPDYSKLC